MCEDYFYYLEGGNKCRLFLEVVDTCKLFWRGEISEAYF